MTPSNAAAPPLDGPAAEAFADRIGETINAGAVALMISIGHRTGLFDTMAGRPPATSHDIAAAAELAERYVREWLAVMVTGGIVAYDPARRTYALPAEACGMPDAERAARQPGGLCPEPAHDGRRAGPPAGMLRDRRGYGLRRLSALPPRHGGGQRPDRCRAAVRRHPAAGAGAAGAARGRDRRPRCRVRQRLCDGRAGGALSQQPLRRLRPLGGRDPRGGQGARRRRARQRALRGARYVGLRRGRTIRPDHNVRRGARPEGPAGADPCSICRAAAGRRLSDAGHRGLGRPGEQHRLPHGRVPLRDLLRPLHAGFARPGRRGSGHHVGLGDGRAHAGRRGLRGRSTAASCRTTP